MNGASMISLDVVNRPLARRRPDRRGGRRPRCTRSSWAGTLRAHGGVRLRRPAAGVHDYVVHLKYPERAGPVIKRLRLTIPVGVEGSTSPTSRCPDLRAPPTAARPSDGRR